ncbi:hypothetical protein HXX76_001383 [Chlamydomonas incerta]|uniref:EXS domain-containing protein n=1 Tax=Chlamydomonas incerta TaxID=51695 RepID=A0A836B1M2_CHLIN|nr:hypothetical protein HXX76_001383 [Chlamydomonas incerta]|eukprot:KAG2444639.1 hypothetical protein HXX76_001383 [Chlamydomonas incerta]
MERTAKQHAGAASRRTTVALFTWCSICCLSLLYFTPRASYAVRDLLLVYFQPMVPVVFALWLWAHNVQRFHALGIEYDMCFSAKDRKYLLSSGELYRIALWLTAVCLTCAAGFASMGALGFYSLADYMPLLMYFAAALFVVAPANVLDMPSRLFFGETLQRVLVPVQEVTWADFLMADIATSLSKSSADLCKAALTLLAGPALHSLVTAGAAGAAPRVVDPLAAPVLFAMCLPYIIRFAQCLIVNRTTGNRAQLLNALKYATAFPALVLTAIEHEYHVSGLVYPMYDWWLGAMFVNSLYSYYWDLEMDWDMPWLAQPGGQTFLRVLKLPGLKSDSMFRKSWYVWAALSNLVLRHTWAHRLIGKLEKHATVLLVMALLEVFRRYQWTYIRVETELRKLRIRASHGHLPDMGQRDSDGAGPGGSGLVGAGASGTVPPPTDHPIVVTQD